MEFRDLKTQYNKLKPQIDQAMSEVAASAHYINGPWVKELEQELAEYVGVKHCISCANGTDALTMAMMAWGIGPGDAVFVPDFTFFSSGEVVSYAGATPIFVDVSAETFNICPDCLEQAIEKVLKEGKFKPRAVVAVDLFGLPANFPRIKEIAKKYNLLVCEDGAQGFGGMVGDKRACSFGDISTTSFFPAKPLGCYGDGGAVFTDDDEIAKLLESIRVHGKGTMKYDNVRIGLNSRLDSIQAAILKIKFAAFADYELDAVNNAYRLYNENLKSLEDTGKIKLPRIPENYLSSFAQYTIQLTNPEKRDELQSSLKEKGIPTMVYYPKPMHNQEAFGPESGAYDSCENTLKLCKSVLSLPMHPYLTESDIKNVVCCLEQEL